MKTILPLLFLVGSAVAMADEVKITLPPETTFFKAAPGAELAQANCLICHSAEYVATQPPMARAFWEAEIKKMREKYGAPTPDTAVTALVDYLAGNYGAPAAAAK